MDTDRESAYSGFGFFCDFSRCFFNASRFLLDRTGGDAARLKRMAMRGTVAASRIFSQKFCVCVSRHGEVSSCCYLLLMLDCGQSVLLCHSTLAAQPSSRALLRPLSGRNTAVLTRTSLHKGDEPSADNEQRTGKVWLCIIAGWVRRRASVHSSASLTQRQSETELIVVLRRSLGQAVHMIGLRLCRGSKRSVTVPRLFL